ncbi:MAG: CHAT domain-containing protein [Trichodesmium sp. St16_bin4-tuft]|nr:CHAT domain-containing protein [Trichodesmium sp. St16_bin4-tuft]
MNPIQKLKNQQSPYPSRLFAQGESPDKLLNDQELELEKIEGLTDNNKSSLSESFGIKLDGKFDGKFAFLEVESPNNNNDNIIIRCRHGSLKIGEQLDTDPTPAPRISFDNIINLNLEETPGIMRMFSQKNSQAKKIRGWLLKLQEKLQERQHNFSYLIINDRTTFEIPWEMLELKDNDYLGASLVTVRWQDITNPEDLDNVNDLIKLEVTEKKCCGKIVAYLNTKDLPKVEQEKEIIEVFHSTIYDDVRNFFDDLDKVNLDQVNSEVSLVFIASHGFFDKDLSQSKLGEKDETQQISVYDLYEYDFNFFKKGSIVFMNACNSGRLQQNDTLKIVDTNPTTGQEYPIGFSTFFLEKGAEGVIGTLCEVYDTYAAKISRNFFQECQKYPHLSVATILKNLRRKAADEYQRHKGNDENKYLFIFTFMYIYYGNPMAKLELLKKEGI